LNGTIVDIDNFDKWSKQFNAMLIKLNDHENELQTARHDQLRTISDCQKQVAVEGYLRAMANDIRALGFCYNNLRQSIHMQQEQFDSLD